MRYKKIYSCRIPCKHCESAQEQRIMLYKTIKSDLQDFLNVHLLVNNMFAYFGHPDVTMHGWQDV